jgi:hypothetical protein
LDGQQSISDVEIIRMAANGINGHLFRDLYMGHWQHLHHSQYLADQAFVEILLSYTNSTSQIAHILRTSELGKQDEAQRSDYYLFHPNLGVFRQAHDRLRNKPPPDPDQYFKRQAATAIHYIKNPDLAAHILRRTVSATHR